MRLTAQGQQLYQCAGKTDSMLREAFSQIRNDDVLTGCFRLTVPVKAAGNAGAGTGPFCRTAPGFTDPV